MDEYGCFCWSLHLHFIVDLPGSRVWSAGNKGNHQDLTETLESKSIDPNFSCKAQTWIWTISAWTWLHTRALVHGFQVFGPCFWWHSCWKLTFAYHVCTRFWWSHQVQRELRSLLGQETAWWRTPILGGYIPGADVVFLAQTSHSNHSWTNLKILKPAIQTIVEAC